LLKQRLTTLAPESAKVPQRKIKLDLERTDRKEFQPLAFASAGGQPLTAPAANVGAPRLVMSQDW
jgi:hypothetical protein